MKKLLISAVAVGLVAFAQAGNVTWKVVDISASTKGSADKYITYFLMSADDTGAQSAKLWSIADATAAAKEMDAASFESHTIPAAVAGDVDKVETFAIKSAKYTDSASQWVSGGGVNNYGTFYAVVFNAADVKDATQFLIAGGDEGTQLKFGTATANQTATLSPGAWQAVPEPFSGALALLGMVGIGLRRKLKKAKKA